MGDKYVVFKKEDYDRFNKHNNDPNHEPRNLDDAVVIRSQDVFAGPGLHAYAGVVQTAIDLTKMEFGFSDGDDEIAHLEHLRDFFHSKAVDADESPIKKLPD